MLQFSMQGTDLIGNSHGLLLVCKQTVTARHGRHASSLYLHPFPAASQVFMCMCKAAVLALPVLISFQQMRGHSKAHGAGVIWTHCCMSNEATQCNERLTAGSHAAAHLHGVPGCGFVTHGAD